jgi:hypothetical protein
MDWVQVRLRVVMAKCGHQKMRQWIEVNSAIARLSNRSRVRPCRQHKAKAPRVPSRGFVLGNE